MKVIDPGHVYQLDWLDVDPNAHLDASTAHALGGWDGTDLVFVKREGPGYPGNVGRHPGTNMQEVLRALIDRVKYLDNQIPDVRNGRILDHLRLAICWVEQRAVDWPAVWLIAAPSPVTKPVIA